MSEPQPTSDSPARRGAVLRGAQPRKGLTAKVVGLVALALATTGWTFEHDPDEVRSCRRGWQVVARGQRVSFYGSYFTDGMTTASGEPYSPSAQAVALGPALLRRARAVAGQDWLFQVRITDEKTGRAGRFKLTDTGSARLEIDLPDETWLQFGHDPSIGVFLATLEVRGMESAERRCPPDHDRSPLTLPEEVSP